MTHSELVKMLVKPGKEIASELSPDDCNLIHMVLGISGEAGELLDAIKKATIYQKQIDIANIIEELGDLEFYMEGLRQALNISREECIEHNIKKLSIRYKELKYSNKAAVKREDKILAVCPKCNSMEVTKRHHPGSFALPECDFCECSCGHQWNHS